MSAQALIDRLDKAKRIRPGAWKACCPAHDDKRPSLYITEKDDGLVLLNCMSHGCDFNDIIEAVGIEAAELFPPKPPRAEGYRPIKRPFFPSDVFEDLRHEVTVVYLVGCDLRKNKSVSEEDYKRLGEAVSTLERIAQAAYER